MANFSPSGSYNGLPPQGHIPPRSRFVTSRAMIMAANEAKPNDSPKVRALRDAQGEMLMTQVWLRRAFDGRTAKEQDSLLKVGWDTVHGALNACQPILQPIRQWSEATFGKRPDGQLPPELVRRLREPGALRDMYAIYADMLLSGARYTLALAAHYGAPWGQTGAPNPLLEEANAQFREAHKLFAAVGAKARTRVIEGVVGTCLAWATGDSELATQWSTYTRQCADNGQLDVDTREAFEPALLHSSTAANPREAVEAMLVLP